MHTSIACPSRMSPNFKFTEIKNQWLTVKAMKHRGSATTMVLVWNSLQADNSFAFWNSQNNQGPKIPKNPKYLRPNHPRQTIFTWKIYVIVTKSVLTFKTNIILEIFVITLYPNYDAQCYNSFNETLYAFLNTLHKATTMSGIYFEKTPFWDLKFSKKKSLEFMAQNLDHLFRKKQINLMNRIKAGSTPKYPSPKTRSLKYPRLKQQNQLKIQQHLNIGSTQITWMLHQDAIQNCCF